MTDWRKDTLTGRHENYIHFTETLLQVDENRLKHKMIYFVIKNQ